MQFWLNRIPTPWPNRPKSTAPRLFEQSHETSFVLQTSFVLRASRFLGVGRTQVIRNERPGIAVFTAQVGLPSQSRDG